jgi:hypothetical protein
MTVHPEGHYGMFVGDAVDWAGERLGVKRILGRSLRPLCRRARGLICLLESPGEVIFGLIAAGGEKRRRKERGKDCWLY